GYNLRGLSGDPVRCPERGFQNAIAIMEVPAAEITAQLKRMESAPAYSFALLLVIFVSFAFQSIAFRAFGQFTPCSIAFLGRLLLFPYAVHRAGESCRRQPGWLVAMVTYYWFGGLMMAGAFAMLGFAGYLLFALLDKSKQPLIRGWIAVYFLAGM